MELYGLDHFLDNFLDHFLDYFFWTILKGGHTISTEGGVG